MIARMMSLLAVSSSWHIFAAGGNGEGWAGLGVTTILAGLILWLVRGDRDHQAKSIEAANRSAAAIEKLTELLESRPCVAGREEE